MTATLLLADDSPTIQRVIELTFAGEDVRVVAVGDGDAAIKSMEQQPPDIVLADVGMPFRTGYEVASYVKQSPRLSHIPVVLLTGAFEPIDQRKADESGCDGVLAKPFEPQLVVARVKELLASASRPSPVSAPPQITPVPVHAEAPLSESLGDFFDKLDEAFANAPAAEVYSPSPAAGAPAVSPASAADKPAMPPLADAFATLLAAEEPGAAPANTAAWVRPPIVTDELVDRVADRVLERLSARAVHETTAQVVAPIVERLVRDELDRIKTAIKNL